MAEHAELDSADEDLLSLYSDLLGGGNLTVDELFSVHPLTHVEMVIQSYVMPAVFVTASVSLLLTLAVLCVMTWRVLDVHAYLLFACLTDLVALALDLRTAGWVSHVIGHTTHYAHRLMHLSEVSCICTNYVIGCAHQLPRYLLIALTLDSCVTQRVPRLVRHLTWLHVKDMVIVNVVLTMVANVHYFWTYDLTILPLAGSGNQVLWHRACKLRSNIDQSSNTAVDRIGYIISGYTWLVEHFVPFIILSACRVVMATSSRTGSGKRRRGIEVTSLADDEYKMGATVTLEEGRPTRGATMTSSSRDLDPYSELTWGEHTRSLVVRCTPHLAVAHLVCSVLTVTVWPLKSLVLVDNEQLLNAAGMILMETLAELMTLALPIVNLSVFLVYHPGFRRRTSHLLLTRRLRHLFSVAITTWRQRFNKQLPNRPA